MGPVGSRIHALRFGIVCTALTSSLIAAPAIADYPALNRALNAALEKTAEAAKGKRTLVFVFDATQDPQPWRLRSAVQTEVLYGLKEREVDAIDVEREPAFAWLSSREKVPAAADVARWRKGPEFDALVLGTLLPKRDGLELRLAVHTRAPAKTTAIPPVRL